LIGVKPLKKCIKVFALIACLPLSAVAQSLQCGGKLITNGTSQVEVSARCGQPTQIEHQALYGEKGTAVGPAATPLGLLPPIGVREGTEIPVEIWTYEICGKSLSGRAV
jgi:hypothetical protein